MTAVGKAAFAMAVAFAAATIQAAPANNISSKKHPNLAAAQHLTTQAYDKIVAAQNANEFDLGGHAKKARELLEQANRELKAAAEYANAK